MSQTKLHIADVGAVTFTAEGHQLSPGGTLMLRVVTRDPLTGAVTVVRVALETYDAKAWDVMAAIARAAQPPYYAEDEANETSEAAAEAAAEEALIASLPQI